MKLRYTLRVYYQENETTTPMRAKNGDNYFFIELTDNNYPISARQNR